MHGAKINSPASERVQISARGKLLQQADEIRVPIFAGYYTREDTKILLSAWLQNRNGIETGNFRVQFNRVINSELSDGRFL